MIMEWQSTPQLSLQKEFRRRQLLKIFSYKMKDEKSRRTNDDFGYVQYLKKNKGACSTNNNLIREIQYIDMEKYIVWTYQHFTNIFVWTYQHFMNYYVLLGQRLKSNM